MKVFAILATIVAVFMAFAAVNADDITAENCCVKTNANKPYPCCSCYPPFANVICSPHSCYDCTGGFTTSFPITTSGATTPFFCEDDSAQEEKLLKIEEIYEMYHSILEQ